jgi:hypothetical protein
MRLVRLCVLALLTSATSAGAQAARTPLDAAPRVRSAAGALAVEWVGATGGSLVSAIAAYQVTNATRGACDGEDVECIIGRLGVIGAVSVFGAAGGGYAAGRAADTRPSWWGGLIGAFVGVGAGVAAVKGLDELGARGRWTQGLGYCVSQGLLTAVGSRLLARR